MHCSIAWYCRIQFQSQVAFRRSMVEACSVDSIAEALWRQLAITTVKCKHLHIGESDVLDVLYMEMRLYEVWYFFVFMECLYHAVQVCISSTGSPELLHSRPCWHFGLGSCVGWGRPMYPKLSPLRELTVRFVWELTVRFVWIICWQAKFNDIRYINVYKLICLVPLL